MAPELSPPTPTLHRFDCASSPVGWGLSLPPLTVEEEEVEVELHELMSSLPSPLDISSACAQSSGRTCLRAACHFAAIFGRDLRACRQTRPKFTEEQKLCVTATDSSRFKTAWLQPAGTNTVSPGRCSKSMGRA